MPVMPPCQRPAPVTAGDEPGPATLCTPTTMRTSAPTDIDLKPGQPHTVHRLSAAWSTDPGECGAAAPLTLETELADALCVCVNLPPMPRSGAALRPWLRARGRRSTRQTNPIQPPQRTHDRIKLRGNVISNEARPHSAIGNKVPISLHNPDGAPSPAS